MKSYEQLGTFRDTKYVQRQKREQGLENINQKNLVTAK